ncbi:hypothetical protein CEP54_013344 [Fusarium duplospermum]|uniref:Uncharacterized protein n=1 Tax=Fusarium duplospermum TaxID=1325734 RepID=A0A428P3F4_9HYPO|nr:hypothetical protein CEP54_013344 [Fusarium duplospermum]
MGYGDGTGLALSQTAATALCAQAAKKWGVGMASYTKRLPALRSCRSMAWQIAAPVHINPLPRFVLLPGPCHGNLSWCVTLCVWSDQAH